MNIFTAANKSTIAINCKTEVNCAIKRVVNIKLSTQKVTEQKDLLKPECEKTNNFDNIANSFLSV